MIAEISCGEYAWSPSETVVSSPIFRLIERIVRSGSQHRLVPRRLADEQPPFGVEADDRRQDRVAVLVREDDRPSVADDRHLAVGRAQVDPDDQFP